MQFLLVEWFGRTIMNDEVGEVVEGGFKIDSVIRLSEITELRPSKIREQSSSLSKHKIFWGSHHLVSSWAHKECQRFPLLVPVHHSPMQRTLVYSIC